MNILFTNHIYEFVSALKDSGHNLYVPDNAKRQRVEECASVHVIPDNVTKDADAAFRWLGAHKIDVIYAQGRGALVFFSRVRKRLAKEKSVKIIAACHTGYVWGVPWKALAFMLTARFYGDGLIFFAKAIYARYSWIGRLLGLPMWTVPHPVDLSRFCVPDPQRLNENRDLRLGYVGIITPNKAQDVLIEAVKILHDNDFPVSLTLVGDVDIDGYYRNLKNRVEELGLQKFVKIVTGVGYADVPQFLSTIDCYVCSSKIEVFPFNILEAMASGLPIIASRIGGIPDLVMDGQNGYLVNINPESIAQALQKLINGRAIGRQGAASRRLATEQFSNEHYRRRMNVIFCALQGRPA